MRKIVLLLSAILFLFNCSSNEEDLIVKTPIIGEWTYTEQKNEDLQNRCEKTSTIKITDDGKYSQSTFYTITDSNNNSVIIDSPESTEDGNFGTWVKSDISNQYILTKKSNKGTLNTSRIILKSNSIIALESNLSWKKTK